MRLGNRRTGKQAALALGFPRVRLGWTGDLSRVKNEETADPEAGNQP
jgi:hypothetical protein